MAAKRLVSLTFGWALVIIGILGMVLPVIPGLPLIAIGLIFLSKSSPWAQQILEKLYARYPKLAEKTKKWRNHPR
ncbi:DUF454 family protein [Desmospora activa]|uniref:Putative transmembrane protein PGPGW n=1 Tax=Desmospora activa DSM 45169 TaxID=1121389 RepID=A0A2T4ZC19_9BACL|nr:PGPGW domain-containing protein [Desmospora activa]PTM59412.1 putative transmembrane protein PGPGW [Desmospora activa DSM 45169]